MCQGLLWRIYRLRGGEEDYYYWVPKEEGKTIFTTKEGKAGLSTKEGKTGLLTKEMKGTVSLELGLGLNLKSSHIWFLGLFWFRVV